MCRIGLALLMILPSFATGQGPQKTVEISKEVAVLRQMGVTLVHENGEPLRPVVAVCISKNGVKEIDGAFALLNKLPDLRGLTLLGTALTPSDREHLKTLKTLQTLRLDMIVGEEDLKALEKLKELRSLDLSKSVFIWVGSNPQSGLQCLQYLPNLRELKLGSAGSGDFRFFLPKMERLERLEDHGSVVAGHNLERYPQLKHLVLKGDWENRMRNAALDKLKNLETLTLGDLGSKGSGRDGRELEKLKGLEKLKELAIALSAEQGKEALGKVQELTQIEELTLGVPQNYFSLAGIEKMVKLRRLSIDAGSYRVEPNDSWLRFPKSLREVHIISGDVYSHGLARLRKERPDLRISGMTEGVFEGEGGHHIRFRK